MDILSPGGSGELTDPEGRSWSVHRRKLDTRTVHGVGHEFVDVAAHRMLYLEQSC